MWIHTGKYNRQITKTIYRRVCVHSLIGIYYAETCGEMGRGGWYMAI